MRPVQAGCEGSSSTCWTTAVWQNSALLVDIVFFCFFQQMDNSVYTFEQLLQQSLDSGGSDDLCKVIQRCQDRVLKVRMTT